MDVTKFRANIVAELTLEGRVKIPLTANCWRCQSLTVDNRTGETATDDSGRVWEEFGRYSLTTRFIFAKS